MYLGHFAYVSFISLSRLLYYKLGMEPSTKQTDRKTPWGILIGLLLILAIVVFGAYYALSERIAAQSTPSAISAR